MSIRSTLRRHPATAVPAIALAGLALAAAGCGSSNDNKSSDSGTKKSSSSGGTSASTLNQTATDFKFSQPSASVKSGKVTVKLTNNGKTAHAIEIEGTPSGDKESGTISPGASTSLKVDLKPGKYEFYCPVANHKELGMKGELTVK